MPSSYKPVDLAGRVRVRCTATHVPGISIWRWRVCSQKHWEEGNKYRQRRKKRKVLLKNIELCLFCLFQVMNSTKVHQTDSAEQQNKVSGVKAWKHDLWLFERLLMEIIYAARQLCTWILGYYSSFWMDLVLSILNNCAQHCFMLMEMLSINAGAHCLCPYLLNSGLVKIFICFILFKMYFLNNAFIHS